MYRSLTKLDPPIRQAEADSVRSLSTLAATARPNSVNPGNIMLVHGTVIFAHQNRGVVEAPVHPNPVSEGDGDVEGEGQEE